MTDMNREEILQCLKKYNFDKEEYLVISGAAMALLGIKESTNDIDISVTQNYYNYLLKKYNCIFERTNEYGVDCYLIDEIINFSTTYYENNKILIDDIPVQEPQKILKLKRSLNREKDNKDINLIKEFINE